VFTEDLILVPLKQDIMDTADNLSPLETTTANATTIATAEDYGRKRNYPFVAPGEWTLQLEG